jgi:hypothetical protein
MIPFLDLKKINEPCKTAFQEKLKVVLDNNLVCFLEMKSQHLKPICQLLRQKILCERWKWF